MDKPEIDIDGYGVLFSGYAPVIQKKKIQENVFLLETEITLERSSQVSPLPGQFYLVKNAKSSVQFGRPISVYQADRVSETKLKVKFLILKKGRGTEELCSLLEGEDIFISGPMGNCFKSEGKNICICGAGIGVAPVAFFASSLPSRSYDFYASFKSGKYGIDSLEAQRITITTEDGSEGTEGILSDVLTADIIKEAGYSAIYACGPSGMLSYIQKIAEEAKVKCYLSIEKKMLCGIGACLGCTVRTKNGNRRVCKEGPVFNSDEISFLSPIPKKETMLTFSEKDTPDLSVSFAGLNLKNPVIAASGTFGFGQNYRAFFDVSRLGGICSKGLTLLPQNGNSGERVFEVASGCINSIGLENPGVLNFIKDELPGMLSLNTICIANLAGHSLDDYAEGARLLDETKIDAIELNISCPNVKEGGMAWGMKANDAFNCVKAVRQATKKPLIVKLTPNAPNLIEVALACADAGSDALSLINTIQATAIDIEKGRPIFDNITAGLCGPSVKPIALRMVMDVVRAMNSRDNKKRLPVIGLGGISKWQDAVEFIMAGAMAVQVGTATFSNPKTMIEIIEGLETFMHSHGYKSLSDFRGCAL